jgi:hypothetical protein
VQQARPKLVSRFTTAKKLGIWVPDDRIFSIHPPRAMDLITDYLMSVGTMLSDGHFAEAKQAALERKEAFFAAIVVEDEKTKRKEARQRG